MDLKFNSKFINGINPLLRRSELILEAARRATTVEKTGRFTLAKIAEYLGIPYLAERETNKILNVRHDGAWVPIANNGGQRWDHGKDYSDEYQPDSYNSVDEGLSKIGKPIAMWYHIPTMNLVIQDEKSKVGIRRTSFLKTQAELLALIDGLQFKMLETSLTRVLETSLTRAKLKGFTLTPIQEKLDGFTPIKNDKTVITHMLQNKQNIISTSQATESTTEAITK